MKNQTVAYGPTCAAHAIPSDRVARLRGIGDRRSPDGGVRGIDRSATPGSAS
jgi:hypothetical protein